MSEIPEDHRMKKIPTIGVLAGWQFYNTAQNFSYLEPIYRGISHAAQDLGCNLMLGCGMGFSASLSDPLKPAWPVPGPNADFVPIGPWNTDGLIIVNPLHDIRKSEYVQRLIKSGHPVLFLGAGERGHALVADNAGGIQSAMQHLVEHGHREIAFIAGSREDMTGDTGARLGAYYEALALHNLPADPRLIAYGRHVYDGGYEAMKQILQAAHSFTAVLASNDESAMGAMQALKEAGFQIPNDVAVVGFDDRPEGIVQKPALTTIHVPLFDMGYRAVDHLAAALKGDRHLSDVQKVQTRLIVRESCGCSNLDDILDMGKPADLSDAVEAISSLVFNQAQGLTSEECFSYAGKIVRAYRDALQNDAPHHFHETLSQILTETSHQEGVTQVWQSVVSFLGKGVGHLLKDGGGEMALESAMLDEARLLISRESQRQHREHLLEDRSISVRLSRLSSQLLTALDEQKIYEAFGGYLPEMGIERAYVAFLSDEEDGYLHCDVLNALDPSAPLVSSQTYAFPPRDLFEPGQPFQLTLIPLLDQDRQIGFAVFDTNNLELYGSIVQQLVSALKTVDLYRQATEGRQLAEEANRLKSRFLSTISHELRTPLNLIVGLSGILLRDSDERENPFPDPSQKDIERIHAYAQHLGGLIGDVLDLATSDAGKLKLNLEPLDLCETLEMVATSGRQLAADNGLKWQVEMPESSPWVMGDRTRLRQIVLNLINNAIKFTEEGHVRLAIEADGESVTVSITDTGMGIPEEEQAIIFNEFYRTERSVNQGFSGLGLGLAISRRLIEMHQGVIGVQSRRNEESGSTFYIKLPVIDPPAGLEDETSPVESDQQVILLLTQTGETVDRFRENIRHSQMTVEAVQMQEEVKWRNRVLDAPPDGVVLDITEMPDVAWDTLAKLKANPVTKNIPVMFYAASDSGESLVNFDYMTKPIEQDDLTAALDQYWMMDEDGPSGRTVLLVDDDVNTREMHARIVEAQSPSNRILMAGDGREAIEILQKERVDLVLLDLQMPEVDGFAVLEAMRLMENLRDIPVIVITGMSLTEQEMARLNRGVTVVLRKGLFNVEETLDHIRNAIRRKKEISRDAQRLVRMAMVYLHEHAAEPITRADIAQHVGITEDYLTFCFRQELGTTPIKYLRRLRVNRAKSMLLNSDKSVTEIALSLGFTDSSYFSRVFRRETGVSPDAFRTH